MMKKEMNWKTAIKIYFSKTHRRMGVEEPVPYTAEDMFFMMFLFPITIPIALIYVPFLIYRIKKYGVKKEVRKYFLYYKKDRVKKDL